MKECPFEHMLLEALLDHTCKNQMFIDLGIGRVRRGMLVIQMAKLIVVSGQVMRIERPDTIRIRILSLFVRSSFSYTDLNIISQLESGAVEISFINPKITLINFYHSGFHLLEMF